MSDCPDVDWMPSPPMALEHEWTTWRDEALDWIAAQDQPWTADDIRVALPEPRPHWPGAVVRTASGRELIRLVGQRRSTHPSRKKSLLAIWETTKETS